MFCGKCGAKIDGKNLFCPNCGNYLNQHSVSSVEGSPSSTPINDNNHSKKGKNNSVWAFILIIFILISLGSCNSCGSSDGANDDGGKCKFCGRQTNWTYRGGGYICWSCDHK